MFESISLSYQITLSHPLNPLIFFHFLISESISSHNLISPYLKNDLTLLSHNLVLPFPTPTLSVSSPLALLPLLHPSACLFSHSRFSHLLTFRLLSLILTLLSLSPPSLALFLCPLLLLSLRQSTSIESLGAAAHSKPLVSGTKTCEHAVNTLTPAPASAGLAQFMTPSPLPLLLEGRKLRQVIFRTKEPVAAW